MRTLLVLGFCLAYVAAEPESASVEFGKSGLGKVEGKVFFNKTSDGIHITGQLTNLTPGKHGFHVHEIGQLTNCLDAKGHFNPHNKDHGAPSDEDRHVGDLGNIEADEQGIAKIDFKDSVIALSGENNIIGRSVVVHEGEDDLGKGQFNDSKTTGHAGARAGCGPIVSFALVPSATPVLLLLTACLAIFVKNI